MGLAEKHEKLQREERSEGSGVRRRPPPPPDLVDETTDLDADLLELIVTAAPTPAEPPPAPLFDDPYELTSNVEEEPLELPLRFSLQPPRKRKIGWPLRIVIGAAAVALGVGVGAASDLANRSETAAPTRPTADLRAPTFPDIVLEDAVPAVVSAAAAPAHPVRTVVERRSRRRASSALAAHERSEEEQPAETATEEELVAEVELVEEEVAAAGDELPPPVFHPRPARAGSALDAVDRAIGNVSDAPAEPLIAEPAAPEVEEPSTPTRDQVTLAMEGIRPEVVECSAGRHGVAHVQATVRPSGRVRFVRVTGTYAGTAEGSCIARLARTVRFPEFEAESFVVRYPFRL